MYLLGLDIGSSSIKASVIDGASGKMVASATSPETELNMIAHQPGWAEQEPDTWWQHVKNAVAKILKSAPACGDNIGAIGISYQMHGLVAVDKAGKPLRPSIIWCDSRAVEIGNQAFKEIGEQKALEHLLNSPGNFTASKLKWVKENEPETYQKIDKIMLPGDYIAYLLTGQMCTTPSGLSEGIMWDYKTQAPADIVFENYGIDKSLLPEVVPSFGDQGKLSEKAATELGIKPGAIVAYRGGDQPNNAFSLNVLNPGDVAANAGTSGVIYGIADTPAYDPKSRVNTFVHVNHTETNQRYGVLACVNGTGILNSWLRRALSTFAPAPADYAKMNDEATNAPVGSDGLMVFPYGNGAERTLANKEITGRFVGLDFNRHTSAHLLRAAQEGIVFALNYGFDIMKEMGLKIETVKAGEANMFLSPIFREAFATISNSKIELVEADGAMGAARAAGVGCGYYNSSKEAFSGIKPNKSVEPNAAIAQQYKDAYLKWKNQLGVLLSK